MPSGVERGWDRIGRISLSSALRRAQQWLRDDVTAKMAAETYLQRQEQALQEKDDVAVRRAFNDYVYYDLMPADSHPFAHPVYWAPFTLSGQ